MDIAERPGDSPFLPGTFIQWAWDSTSLGWYKTCPRLYQYQMIEGWRPKGEGIHLRWGQEYHKALEEYDINKCAGLDHETAIKQSVLDLLIRIKNWDPDPNLEKRSEKLKTKEHLVRSVIWYLDKYEDDPAQTYVMGGGEPMVEQSFRLELDYGPQQPIIVKEDATDIGPGAIIRTQRQQPYVLCGHLDRVVNFNDDLYVMDRKTTTTTVGSYYFEQYSPNNQMSLYILAASIIFKAPIKGAFIDAMQVAEGFSRPVRGMTYRSKDQIEEWLGDLRIILEEAERHAIAGYWPMNDTSCDKFGGCRFRQVCSKSPQVREHILQSSYQQEEPWNPLIPRQER